MINITQIIEYASQINKDIWLPSTVEDVYYTNESAWKFGIMLSYAMTTYTASDSYAVNSLLLPPNKSVFAPPANIEAKAADWVAQIESRCSPDFYVILSDHHIGFNLWPSVTNLPEQTGISDAVHGTVTLPFYQNYSSDYDHIGAFVSAVKALGKPIIIYHNTGKDINARGSDYYGDDLIYQDYRITKWKEIISRYNPYGIWCDAMQFYPTGNDAIDDYAAYQKLYTELKNYKNKIRITHNSNNGALGANSFYDSNGDLLTFPKDTASREANISNTSEWSALANYDGTNYYINFEKVTTIGVNKYLGDNIPIRTLEDVQNQYNLYTSYGARYCLSVAPNKNGDIPADQLTLLDNLVL